VHFVTNSKGFRNTREFDYVPSHGVSRILLTGDSYVDGMRTDQQRTIGALLETELNAHCKSDRRVEVMIAGNNNPANAWYYYQEHGWMFHPDLVVLGLTIGNDFTTNNYRHGFLPVAGEDGRVVLIKADSAIHQESVVQVLLPKSAYRPPSRWRGFEMEELQVRQWLAEHFRAFGYAIPPALIPWDNFRRHVYATEWFVSLGLFYRPGIPEIQEAYKDMDETLTGMGQAVRTNDTAFLVLLFPVRIQVAEKDWDLLARFYALDRGQFDLQKPNRRVLAVCEQHSIECLDCTPALQEWYGTHGEPAYRARGDMHFNERGQQVVAEYLAAYLLKHHAEKLGLSPE
jgi:hypothetical protein